jgi:hypothetical protein
VQLVDVNGVDLLPAVCLDVVEVIDPSGVGIPMGSVVDGALAEVDGLVDGKVGAVKSIEDTIGVSGTRTDGEEVVVEASSVIVYIVKLAVVVCV